MHHIHRTMNKNTKYTLTVAVKQHT